MALITLHQISIQFGGPQILDNVTLSIEPGDRACVTGRNGEGKSTLLKIIDGILEPDSGDIVRQPGLRTAYLSQDVPGDLPGTALEVAEQGLKSAGGEDSPRSAKPFLTRLGLDPDAVFNTLSGGLRRRVLLARALASDPQLLLLDEPTNHLDIATIEWLENFLLRSKGACLFVTHDRAFLRHVAKSVLDLDRGQLAGWDCDYATFLQRKQDLMNDETVYWERKGKRLAMEEKWLRRGVTARRRRNEGRVEALKKLREEFRQRRTQSGVSRIQIDASESSGQQVMKIEHMSFAYPGCEPLIKDFSAKILRGERIGIIGPNGSGKTTLLNLLIGRLSPTAGSISIGERLQLAFFDQLHAQLDLDKSVAENIAEDRDEVIVGGQHRHIYSYLEDFLFMPERARTPVHALSGGERARLLIAKLFLLPGNLLVMDEPTNDLDIETLELLEEQLMNFPGTILLVSHDRTFLDNVVTSSFVLEGDGHIAICPGGYEDWLQQRGLELKAKRDAQAAEVAPSAEPPPKARRERLSYNDQRDRIELPKQIDALEKEIAALNATLCDMALYRTNPISIEKAKARLPLAQSELDALFNRWAELEEKAERLGS
jgi:ATP-binding cassette subfamily F protein uup